MAQRIVIPGFRKIETSGGGECGTSNYNELTNKPSINNVPLVGNLNTVNLKLTDATLTEEGVPAEAKTVGELIDTLNSNIKDIDGKYIAGSVVVRGGETATTPAIPSNYNGLRLYYYDGKSGLRQSVIIPLVQQCSIPYMTTDGILFVNMTVNSDRTITFSNTNSINLVITHMYAVVINTQI